VLYRATVSSLSVARAVSLDRNVLDYLESLSARAYLHVYGPRRSFPQVVGTFLARSFPRLVRRHAIALALAAAVMAAGAVAGWQLCERDPELFYAFVPGELVQGRGPTASTEALREMLYSTRERADELAIFAASLFDNNARVGMFAFALGFAAGVPVFLLMLTTGLMLGAFGQLHAARGLGVEFWGWVLPHGVTELLAVLLCGAAGLVIAKGLVFPGRYSRLENLARDGREAGMIVVGAVLMLFVAALIEGIFRQTVRSDTVRYVVAVSSALLWLAYFTLAGRVTDREKTP
jgi:uncharacterized membrane protein SpoIIM required for sporulation